MQQENLIKKFIYFHLIAVLLFFSWYLPVTNVFWQKVDTACFEYCNRFLADKPLMQLFWALANIRLCDLFGAVFMISFSFIWACGPKNCPRNCPRNSKSLRKERFIQCLYVLIWFELGILTLKELLFPYVLNEHFLRDSPSLVLKSSCMLSECIPWLKVKDSSHWSFPSDHAFIILQWATFMLVFAGPRIGALAYLSSILFILPRLFSGAHWLSDILAGSLPLALIVVSWARFTPIYRMSLLRNSQPKKCATIS